MLSKTRIIKSQKPKRVIVDQRTVNLSMAINDTATQKQIELPRGNCIRVAAFITGNDPVEPVNIAIKDTAGSDVVSASHYKDWQKGNAGYFESMKAVNFKNSTVNVHITSNVALTNKLEIQLLFIVDVNDQD